MKHDLVEHLNLRLTTEPTLDKIAPYAAESTVKQQPVKLKLQAIYRWLGNWLSPITQPGDFAPSTVRLLLSGGL